ncbi:tyrosine-type recombinase/integrase [Bradyrhizobium elkanii]
MKKKLTDLYIKSAKADEGTRLDVYDEKATGLMLRVTDKGKKTFSFKYDVPGTRKQIRVTLGTYPEISLDKAREMVDAYRDDLRNGKDPRLEKVTKVTVTSTVAIKTFDAVADEYIEKYSKPNLDSWKNDVQLLRRPRAKWGRRPFASISDDEAMEFLEEVAAEAPVQANRCQSKLYQLWKWAKLPGRKYAKINPFEGLPAQGQENPRERVLDDSEIKTFWVGLDDPDCPGEAGVKGALKLILSTMVRPGQASGALVPELHELESKAPLWHIPKIRVKKRRDIIVPLNDVAVGIIKKAVTDEEQTVVFPSRYEERGELQRNSLAQALTGRPNQRMGIREFLKMDHFTPHDLRRTAATLARRAGAPRPDVKATLDHMEGDVTDIYDKYNMLPEKTVVENILGGELKRLLGDKL